MRDRERKKKFHADNFTQCNKTVAENWLQSQKESFRSCLNVKEKWELRENERDIRRKK
jgi:hypothetical protein